MLSAMSEIYDQQPHLLALYRAMLITAYDGLFRIAEITTSAHVVKAADVHVGTNKKKLMFILRSSKTHNKGVKPQIIKIVATQDQRQKGAVSAYQTTTCPFVIIRHYLAIR